MASRAAVVVKLFHPVAVEPYPSYFDCRIQAMEAIAANVNNCNSLLLWHHRWAISMSVKCPEQAVRLLTDARWRATMHMIHSTVVSVGFL